MPTSPVPGTPPGIPGITPVPIPSPNPEPIPNPRTTTNTDKLVRPDVDTDDDEPFALEFDSEISKQFTGGVATPESVLSAESPTDPEFTDISDTPIETDATPELVEATGDIPATVEEELQ